MQQWEEKSSPLDLSPRGARRNLLSIPSRFHQPPLTPFTQEPQTPHLLLSTKETVTTKVRGGIRPLAPPLRTRHPSSPPPPTPFPMLRAVAAVLAASAALAAATELLRRAGLGAEPEPRPGAPGGLFPRPPEKEEPKPAERAERKPGPGPGGAAGGGRRALHHLAASAAAPALTSAVPPLRLAARLAARR